jgi:hypothetical protein
MACRAFSRGFSWASSDRPSGQAVPLRWSRDGLAFCVAIVTAPNVPIFDSAAPCFRSASTKATRPPRRPGNRPRRTPIRSSLHRAVPSAPAAPASRRHRARRAGRRTGSMRRVSAHLCSRARGLDKPKGTQTAGWSWRTRVGMTTG